MRFLLATSLVFLSLTVFANSPDKFFRKADQFFSEYVDNGTVAYQEVKKHPGELNQLVSMIREVDIADKPDKTKLAFYINAYNVLTIKEVIQHYPITSPRDVNGFFDDIEHNVAGEQLTLNELEHNRIRKFNDPRIHFVVVCAAKGCPKIMDFSYKPSKLDKQLERRTRKTLNDDYYVRIKNRSDKVLISELFDWYKKDFLQKDSSLIGYINQYREDSIPEDYEVAFYPYNWKLNGKKKVSYYLEGGVDQAGLPEKDTPQKPVAKKKDTVAPIGKAGPGNLQNYTPSILLAPGQWEYKMFNNLYTQTAFFNGEGRITDKKSRKSFFTGLNQFLYGISPRVNIGFDVWIKSSRTEQKPASPFNTLAFEQNSFSRTALAYAGPKVKFTPFKELNQFSIQSTMLFPVVSNLEGKQSSKPYVDEDRYLWINQFFYDTELSRDFRLFSRVTTWVSIDRQFDSDEHFIQTPASTFLSYFPNDRFSAYTMVEFWPTYGKPVLDSWFVQNGVGVKYQVIPGLLEAEGLLTKFTFGRNTGAGMTYNLGLRLIH